MDRIDHNRLLYRLMNEELSSFLATFPRSPSQASQHLQRMHNEVARLRGPLLREIEALEADVRRYIQQPQKAHSERILREALRIKNEVEEL